METVAVKPTTVAPITEHQETSEISAEGAADGKTSPSESQYDSAGGDSDHGDKDRRSGDSESDSEGSVEGERDPGDGQESVPPKKVDDDEDKKNPQYIPKRGTFYEHDDRTADDIEAETAEAEKEKDAGKKKVWQDKKEKWGHDRFNETEQLPKSRTELVNTYGYDIRNEDGPPRARRRRRYGRGPNKYTRNWEDEDAYNKPAPPRPNIKKPTGNSRTNQGEDFPPLSGGSPTEDTAIEDYPDHEEHSPPRQHNRERNNREISHDRDNGYEPIETNTNANNNNNARHHEQPRDFRAPENSFRQQQHQQPQQQQQQQQPQQHPFQQQQQQQQPQRYGSGRVIKPKREIKDSDYRGFTTKTRQVRNVKTDQKILPRSQQQQQQPPPHNNAQQQQHHQPTQRRGGDDFIQSQNFTNRNNMHEIDKDMARLNVQDGVYKGGKHGGGSGGQRQGSVPPRLQASEQQKGSSKRYSSIRQRSLPEATTPPFTQQHPGYYPNVEYNQQPQNLLHQNSHHPSANQVPQIAPPPLTSINQVPVTATPILTGPQFAPQPFVQAPPQFLQAGVAPQAFLPPPAPQIINYVPTQPPQFAPGYQGYQQQFNPVTQPTELYQPQGGITYYSADQQIGQRPVLKRPKAAIPIVAPPTSDFKGKLRDDESQLLYEDDVSCSINEQEGDALES